jgi:hypothetical protein
MRVAQSAGTRGSLRWIQKLVSSKAVVFEAELRVAGILADHETVTWLSPREEDDWAEYRDGDFLQLLGLERLGADLKGFWPSRGPQWDALGLTSMGRPVLVEAKAHLGELTSNCQASEASLAKIHAALQATKETVGAHLAADWLNKYYQYANRLAHLYFTNDNEMRGPKTAAEWKAGLQDAYVHLDLPSRIVGLADVFIDVGRLT